MLTVALPKGELFGGSLECLAGAGLDVGPIKAAGRRLSVEVSADGVRYLLLRPSDVPTYVEYGAADLGIVGKDGLLEQERRVMELEDLGFGRCRFVAARPVSRRAIEYGEVRVATKYPKVASEHYARAGRQAEIIRLRGSVELAPDAGLADEIVDLAATGRTLAAHGLEVVDVIHECSARLIANHVSHRLKSEESGALAARLARAAK